MAQPATDFTLDTATELAELERGPIEGRSPWYLAWRRLRRNYVALGALILFLAIVFLCAMAPWYADNIAETGPNRTHLTDKVEVDGKLVDVISPGGTEQDPETGELRIKTVTVLGPQLWNAGGKYVLGAEFTRESAGERGESHGTTKLYVNDRVVDEGPMRTQPGKFTLCGDGLCVGRDSSDAVSSLYSAPGTFKGGTIAQVEVSVGADQYLDLEKEAFAALARE